MEREKFNWSMLIDKLRQKLCLDYLKTKRMEMNPNVSSWISTLEHVQEDRKGIIYPNQWEPMRNIPGRSNGKEQGRICQTAMTQRPNVRLCRANLMAGYYKWSSRFSLSLSLSKMCPSGGSMTHYNELKLAIPISNRRESGEISRLD